MIRPPRKCLLFLSAVLPCLLGSCERNQSTGDNSSPAASAASPSKRRVPAAETAGTTGGENLAEADAIQDKEARRRKLEDLVWENADRDPDLACKAFDLLRKDGPPGVDLTGFLAGKLTDKDPESAVAWAKLLARNENRDAAYAHIALTLAGTAPKHAAELAVKYLPPGSGHDDIFVGIAGQWAATDPLSAAKWIVRFPKGEARQGGLKAVLARWSAPVEAVPWIGSLIDHEVRSEALSALADLVKGSPEKTGASWLQAFTDEGQKEEFRKLLTR